MKKLNAIFLTSIVIIGFSLANITNLSSAQPSATNRMSGYILDSNGQGIGGAEIIFGVPTIVPSVHSTSSGYYEIFAPSGTYHLDVWPPFDSNFLYYDQPSFVVQGNVTKNITLATGCKVSGYVTDSSGTPIKQAIVSLDRFFTGYPSNYEGYYFVTAPAGIYTLSAQPRIGYPSFQSYFEYNFEVAVNMATNITVKGSSSTTAPTSTSTPSPTPSLLPVLTESNQSLQSYSDDFSTDSSAWQYLGSTHRDQTNQYLVLTTSDNDQGGVAFFKVPIRGSFMASFRYKSGGSDGFTVFFYKQKYSNADTGGSQGFSVKENSTLKPVPGYGIEFDGWRNIPEDFQKMTTIQQNPQGDPSASHIALIQDFAGNHLKWIDDPRASDGNWHQASILVQSSSVSVFVDQSLVLQWNGTLDRTYDTFGFSGGTGDVSSWHLIDDFAITAHNVQKTSLTLSCRSSTSFSGFNVEIKGSLVLNGTAKTAAPILLSYSVTGGKSWQDLTLVYTGSDGSYFAVWLPSVTGNYLIRATFEGDAETIGTSETVNLAVIQSTENKVFSVSSNSSITSLAFNSTTSELSFTVSGPNGTSGYVRITLAKNLIPNAENIKVKLDGKQVGREVTSDTDSWLVSFNYTHSAHEVSVNFVTDANQNSLLGTAHWSWGFVAIVIGVVGLPPLLVCLKKRKQQNTSEA